MRFYRTAININCINVIKKYAISREYKYIENITFFFFSYTHVLLFYSNVKT